MALKFINEWTTHDFEVHLHSILGLNKSVAKISIAGDGNMNFTLRLIFDDNTSIIAKQSPPYCARFPDIPAPEDRIFSEMKYYQLLDDNQFLSKHSPELLGIDQQTRIAYISDLGHATDFEYLYKQDEKLDKPVCEKLIQYLVELHKLQIPPSIEFENLEMRNLNHAYIFHLPFLDEKGPIDLDQVTEGLTDEVNKLVLDQELRSAAKDLGNLYYKKTRTLVHGDYYPMSWINTEKGLFIIDPEFGFLGLPEIDLGVFLAHMLLSNNFDVAYTALRKIYGPCDYQRVAKFCAVEVIRRITYVSQLPIINSLPFKKELLLASAEVLKTGKIELYEILTHRDH